MSTSDTTTGLPARLIELFGDRAMDGRSPEAASYRHDMVADEAFHQTPVAVVWPRTVDEVSSLLRLASETGTSVTARGAGSGLAGGAVAAAGGIVCSLERMNRIVELDTDNGTITVEPGVITRDLDAFLKPHGLFFAGYPMSEEICTIGGNVATNAGGGRAVKYGVTADHVLGLQVVLASGAVLNLRGKRMKDVTGINLLPLFVGSEGILGIITGITLRLTPRPDHRLAFLASFPDAGRATRAVAALLKSPAGRPASLEYIDGRTARGAAEQLWRTQAAPFDLRHDVHALLLVEADGSSGRNCAGRLESFREAVERKGGTVMLTAATSDSLDQVWKLRKAVPWWVKRRSGPFHSVEDVVVPPASVPHLVQRAQELERESGLSVAIFGHAGDGNFHINPMKPPSMDEDTWRATLEAFLKELYAFVVSAGGTISGEHGIGRKRVTSLSTALSPDEIQTMRRVKAALDPLGLLNPGVLLP